MSEEEKSEKDSNDEIINKFDRIKNTMEKLTAHQELINEYKLALLNVAKAVNKETEKIDKKALAKLKRRSFGLFASSLELVHDLMQEHMHGLLDKPEKDSENSKKVIDINTIILEEYEGSMPHIISLHTVADLMTSGLDAMKDLFDDMEY